MSEFEPVIGLEIHAELQTASKMFCGCPVVDSTSAEPNTAVCEICTGMPGTLPVINRRAVEYAVRVALALGCQIHPTSVFARKNYFYPDLPKGFQISQYELPLATDGALKYLVDGEAHIARIRRVHLEEDTGKLFHNEGYSLVDYNRSGVPLLEIVSEPDLHSVSEASAYATAMRIILQYLGVNSGDMEKGVIRFEANVSLRRKDSQDLNTRVEIKNLNSFRAMARSIAHEIERQSGRLSSGLPVEQETLGWDEARQVTVPQRGKEEANDYRYFPEPDLPPLAVSSGWIDEIRRDLPELPLAKRQRFMEEYHLPADQADVLVGDRAVAEYFEAAVGAAGDALPEKVGNWLTGELFSLLNQAGVSLPDSPIEPAALADLVRRVEDGEINASTGKDVLDEAFRTGRTPSAILQAADLSQENDPATIGRLVDRVIQDNPKQVETYLLGKETVAQWFFGQVMRASQGRANPQIVRSELNRALSALRPEQ